jgi:ABC-type amino acid transport substrate-binding protein
MIVRQHPVSGWRIFCVSFFVKERMTMIVQVVSSTPLFPDAPEGTPAAVPTLLDVAPLTYEAVLQILNEWRQAIQREIDAVRADGDIINVPLDAIFLCELLGLTVNLQSGEIDAIAGDRVVAPAELRRRIALLTQPPIVDGVATCVQH